MPVKVAAHPPSAVLFLLLLLWGHWAAAEPTTVAAQDTTELTVTGERGVLLSVDGKLVGRLPLPAPLLLAAGAHRFQLERQGRRFASDVLAIPPDRVAELSLTPGTKGTAIAVLSLTPMVLLALRSGAADDVLQQAVRRVVQDGARAEHTVLLSADKAAAAARTQPPTCLAQRDCPLALAQQLDARLVLAIDLPPPASDKQGAGAACAIRGEVLDVSTGQSAAQLELPCRAGEDALLETTLQLTRRLISAATNLGKGVVAVTSEPAGAQVVVDGRPRGVTPWQGPCLPGSYELVLNKEGYVAFHQRVTVTSAKLTTVPAELVVVPLPALPVTILPPPVPPPLPPPGPARRPRWRLISGGLMLGAGALLAVFGGSALAWNGHCADDPPLADVPCGSTFQTTGVGGGFFSVGVALTASGVVLLAVPGRQPPRGEPK